MTFSSSLPATPIWFEEWKPKSPLATFAVCLGLCCLSLLYKLVASLNPSHPLTSSPLPSAPTSALQSLNRRISRSENLDDVQKLVPPHDYTHPPRTSETLDYPEYLASADLLDVPPNPRPNSPWSHKLLSALRKINLLRSLLVTLRAILGYLLMLAVMTYNVYYFIAILLGTFLGEAIFGETESSSHDHL